MTPSPSPILVAALVASACACPGAGGDGARDAAADTRAAATELGVDDAGHDGAEPDTIATPDAPPDETSEETSDAAPDATSDAAPDAPDARAPDLGACQGATVPLALAGQLPYVDVAIGGTQGAFLVDWGTTGSAIDPSGFAPFAPTPVPGTADRWAGFTFFGPWAEVVLRVQDFSAFSEPVRQAGILGTDFLALNPFVVDWGARTLARADVGAGCSAAELEAAGLVALSVAGSFVRDLADLDPGMPNVPAVPVRLGAATAPAQIDTGYDDALVGPAINVNRAFFAALDPADLARAPALDLVLTTCVPGLVEPVRAHRLAAGRALELVAVDGAAARRYPDAIVFLKETPAGASACGGIGTWDTPAAQLGVSFVARAGVAVFDPVASRVWLPADPGHAP